MAKTPFKQMSHFEEASEKRISYILITKNRAKALRETLPTLRALVQDNDELIVVDGASSDDTVDVVSDHRDIVTAILSERDANAAHAFNKGILLARGAYVAFIFDEDRVHPYAMAQAITILEAHPEVDMLACGGMKHFRGVARPYYYWPGTNYGKSPEDAFRYGACANGFVMRRSMFARAGLFPTECTGGDDIVFVAQAIARGATVRFCRINLFDFYMTEASTSARLRPQINAMLRRMVRQYCSPQFVTRYERAHQGRERFFKPIWYARASVYWLKMLFAEGPTRVWRRAVRRERRPRAEPEYVWDGGFS